MITDTKEPFAKSSSEMKQKRDRYEMHKYWGKKPANDLNILISKYSEEGDVLLDPFAGYGVFCCEAYIMRRNVICNDLNPIANFIQRQLFRKDVNFSKLDREFNAVVTNLSNYIREWYRVGPIEENQTAVTILRNSKNEIIKCKYRNGVGSGLKEYTYTPTEIEEFKLFESQYVLEDWYPDNELIENSRISAKKGMKIPDLFTTRTLACNSKLFHLIMDLSSGAEQELLLFAFTSNIANCSKLVPPINSRGDMAPGAWMTGFYWGETYLENNVLHYFENRYDKLVKGKTDFLNCFDTMFHAEDMVDIKDIVDLNYFSPKTYGYNIKCEDTRHLSLKSESIDYIFTDPPYGDSVPYFEQSALWNNWLSLTADFENEIIVSNSPSRNKSVKVFCEDIQLAIAEIYRVLKSGKYFSITFHSLSGSEWNGITNGCIKAGFELHNFEWLTQKTFTPRQLNRSKSVKGDVLITLRKPFERKNVFEFNHDQTVKYFTELLDNSICSGISETNSIFMEVVKDIFQKHTLLSNVNFFDILSSNYVFSDNNWSKPHAQ